MGELAVKRVLAAMVMADVVGYSRLMAADEAATVLRLKQYRTACIEPTVRQYYGRVIDAVGDSMFLEFASVVDATHCAIAVQQSIAARNSELPEASRIRLRMGINIGDVIAHDRTLSGDSVNIAARLESIAEPGGICISGAAFDQVRQRVEADFVSLGLREVKNISRPVEVFALSPSAIAQTRPAAPAARRRIRLSRRGAVVGSVVLVCLAGAAIAYGWAYATKAAFERRLDTVLSVNQATLSSRSRASLIERYLADDPHRAFAVAPNARNYWWTGNWSTSALAEEKVLERCQIRFGEPCALVASDNHVMTSGNVDAANIRDMPRLHYVGDFDPRQIPGIRSVIAQRPDVVGYMQSSQPKAAAIHPRGTLSIVTGANSQRAAEIEALRSCNGQTSKDDDGDCFLYAIGNKIVLPMRASAALPNP